MKGIKTSIPFHQQVVVHPGFLEGHYDTGFIDAHMSDAPESAAGGEARRVAVMLAAVAAYRRDKAQAESSVRPAGVGDNPWRAFGRRRALRGSLS